MAQRIEGDKSTDHAHDEGWERFFDEPVVLYKMLGREPAERLDPEMERAITAAAKLVTKFPEFPEKALPPVPALPAMEPLRKGAELAKAITPRGGLLPTLTTRSPEVADAFRAMSQHFLHSRGADHKMLVLLYEAEQEDLSATPVEATPAEAFPDADEVVFGDLHLQIKDPGAATLLRHFLILLTSRGEGLDETQLRRALTALDDALPPTSGTPESDLGPFYTANALAARWGTTRQAVNKRYHRNTLLGLPASDRSVVYPAFQFRDPARPGKHDVLPGIREVTDIITGAGEPKMVVASWLTAPDPRLGEQSAVDWLRAGEDPAVVIGLARTAVARWAS